MDSLVGEVGTLLTPGPASLSWPPDLRLLCEALLGTFLVMEATLPGLGPGSTWG